MGKGVRRCEICKYNPAEPCPDCGKLVCEVCVATGYHPKPKGVRRG